MAITAHEVEASVKRSIDAQPMPVPVNRYEIEWGLDHVQEPALFVRVILAHEVAREDRKAASELIERLAFETAPDETSMVYVSFSTEAEESATEE